MRKICTNKRNMTLTYNIKIQKSCHPKQNTQVASGQGSYWLIESPTICHLCVTLTYLSIFFLFSHIHAASISTILIKANLFHLFIILCANEYFLIFNLHCSFTNITSCPLVLRSSLCDKIYFYQYFHNHSIFFLNIKYCHM